MLLELAKVHTNNDGYNMMTKTLSREKLETITSLMITST